MIRPLAVGPISTIRVPATASTKIELGDAIYLDASTHTIKPATSYPPSGLTSLAAMQEAFHDVFVGISLDQRMAAQTVAGDILAADSGRFTVPCADDATARDIGTLYGMNGVLADGTYTPVNQQVALVATAALAIGRLVKQAPAHCTEVELEIIGTVTLGGPQSAI